MHTEGHGASVKVPRRARSRQSRAGPRGAGNDGCSLVPSERQRAGPSGRSGNHARDPEDHLGRRPRHRACRACGRTACPAAYKEVGPRLDRRKVKNMKFVGGVFSYEDAGRDEDGTWCDWWLIEDLQYPLTRLSAAAGYPRDEITVSPITMDDMRKGCWDQKARLEDMDVNHVDASLAFPSFPRFCGQTFLERKDKTLGDLCVKAYNDWMVDEWCAGTNGRLIPLIIVQLWDAQLAADEIRRNAARGCHAVSFSEIPPFLGFPSIHDKTATGTRSSPRARRPTPSSTCTSGRRRRCRDVGRRARGGRLDAHLHERGDVAHRLADVGGVRTLPAPDDRVQRGPDRLDPLRARTGRQGVGGQPRAGAASPTR